jgi:tRNA pseudouridine55 synthase
MTLVSINHNESCWLNIYKEKGITSYDVIRNIKKLLPKGVKIGHTGTLDPMAEGVLPIAINSATRLIEYLSHKKAYTFIMKLHTQTDTGDEFGSIVNIKDNITLTKKQIADVAQTFLGTIVQTPSKFSAIKINGSRAYDLARQGIDFQMKEREIIIDHLELKSFNEEKQEATFYVECQRGTYVRSLSEDIAKKLGTLAHLIYLRRDFSDSFSLKDATKISELKTIALDQPLSNIPKLVVNKKEFDDLNVGKQIFYDSATDGIYKMYFECNFFAIGNINNKVLKSIKNIRPIAYTH